MVQQSPLLQFIRKYCSSVAMSQSWAPQTRYTLWRITASIMKGLVFRQVRVFSIYSQLKVAFTTRFFKSYKLV